MMASKLAAVELECQEEAEKCNKSNVSNISLLPQAFMTPKSKLANAERKVKLWKNRYMALLDLTRFKRQSPMERLKSYKLLHKTKRRNSAENLILYLDTRYARTQKKYEQLLSNNRDLARSLTEQRLETQH
ncbi:uncharacterized protein LOC108677771 [Hyalella azteca]|uniref:Uncharacterized protein LOC108677771 n=1 Tax=Hyalella azteca TaxID=294128 RepID=A0A8B7P6N2_HYAAZ|nr:uncharacterized protein LOC108677771 [Hyalella azteca]